MSKEKKDSKSIPDSVPAPMVRQFEQNVKEKSRDSFVTEILHISKDLPESPKEKPSR